MVDIQKRQFNYRTFLIDLLPTIFTFIAIIVCGIIFKQKFIKLLPCLISLVVMLLSAKANRLCFLIGALNSGIYCIGYVNEKLFGSVGGAVFSFIIQMFTYFRWRKQAYKQATIFKKMSKKIIILTFIALVSLWVVCYFLFTKIGGKYVIIDNTIFVFGIIIPILILFAYKESQILNLVSGVLNIILWIIVTCATIANITYLIYSVYSLFRLIQGFFTWQTLYSEQQKVISEQQKANSEQQKVKNIQ